MRRVLIACLAALALTGCGGLDDPDHIEGNLMAKLSIIDGVNSAAVRVTPAADGAVDIVVFLETASDERPEELKVMADACKVITTNAPEKGTVKLSAGSPASIIAGTVLQAKDLGFETDTPTLAQARERCR